MAYFSYHSRNIYYTVKGEGKPVIFLHGDTASSKMFEPLLSLYEDKFQVILIDFLGNGRSERVDKFPVDLWQEEARQTVALLEYLKLGKAGIVGCSGGAWAAVNTGLLRPDLAEKVVADSFDGRTLAENFAENLVKERTDAKKNIQAAQFYQWCQGEDWEEVVDRNTEALVRCAQEKRPLFVKPLAELEAPLLLIGSQGDTMTRKDQEQEYEAIAKETKAEICMFEKGEHPALYSNAEKAAEVIRNFLHPEK